MVDSHKQEITVNQSATNITTPDHTPQYLPNRLPCLTSSPPGDVPPIILPLQRKARSAISEVHWIYGSV